MRRTRHTTRWSLRRNPNPNPNSNPNPNPNPNPNQVAATRAAPLPLSPGTSLTVTQQARYLVITPLARHLAHSDAAGVTTLVITRVTPQP